MSGIVGATPELMYARNGETYCNVSMQTTYPGAGKKQVRAFFDVIVFGAQARAVCQHVTKGMKVWVKYYLRWGVWTSKDGTKHKKMEMRVYLIEWQPITKEVGRNVEEENGE